MTHEYVARKYKRTTTLGADMAVTVSEHPASVTTRHSVHIADSVSTSRSRRYMVLSAQNIHFRLRLPCALRPAGERVLGLMGVGR
jgi:hypothetical protein